MGNSTTFSVALGVMEDLPDVRDDLVLTHQGFKVLDFIDEKKELSNDDKSALTSTYLETIRYPDPDKSNVKDLESKLIKLGFDEQDIEHKSLVKNVRKLVRAFRFGHPKVKDIFLEYSAKMAEGFAKARSKEELVDMRDVDTDCLFAAGYVGYLVNSVYEARGITTFEQSIELKNPARTVGKALQLGNNLRDYFKDIENGINHWPKAIVGAINDAVSIENKEERAKAVDEAYKNKFRELVDYSIDKFFRAAEYVTKLPSADYIGHKLFPALSLASYAIVVREVDNPQFIASKGRAFRKPIGELLDAKDVVAALVKDNSDIRPYLEHILIKREPSRRYRS